MKKYTLVGTNGNLYAVMGYVSDCMRKEKKSEEEIVSYTKDAMSSDYKHLLKVSIGMLDKLNSERLNK